MNKSAIEGIMERIAQQSANSAQAALSAVGLSPTETALTAGKVAAEAKAMWGTLAGTAVKAKNSIDQTETIVDGSHAILRKAASNYKRAADQAVAFNPVPILQHTPPLLHR
jgi:hypothetical protein